MINKQDAPYENQEDDSFKLEEFGYILLAHWHWIILSVAIALGVAVLKILRTTPTYVQSTSLLIKSDDGKGGSSLSTDSHKTFRIRNIGFKHQY